MLMARVGLEVRGRDVGKDSSDAWGHESSDNFLLSSFVRLLLEISTPMAHGVGDEGASFLSCKCSSLVLARSKLSFPQSAGARNVAIVLLCC